MPENKKNIPELKLLNSIIEDELKGEESMEIKEAVKKKAQNAYMLLSIPEIQEMESDEVKKRIKSLIEEG